MVVGAQPGLGCGLGGSPSGAFEGVPGVKGKRSRDGFVSPRGDGGGGRLVEGDAVETSFFE